MDWSNEPYVKVYTRETDDDLALSWEAVALWNQLLKKLDRSGSIETKRGTRGLAAITRMPAEVVDRALPELLADGRLVEAEGGFIAPNYIAAQEANKSDKLRQKESRDRRRVQNLDRSVTNRDADVTNRDETSRAVTRGHALSLSALLSSADPVLEEVSPAGTRAIPPSTEPVLPTTTPPKPELIPLAQRQKINTEVWEAARVAHEGLRAAGVDRHARGWTAMPTGAGASELAARTAELCEQLGDVAAVRELHLRVVAVRTEEAKRLHADGRVNALEYFIPTRLYERTSFWKSAELSPEQAAQPKHRAPAMSAFGPPRDVRVVRDDSEDSPPPVHPAFRRRA